MAQPAVAAETSTGGGSPPGWSEDWLAVVAVLALLPAFLIALACEFAPHPRPVATVNGVIYDQEAPVLRALAELPEVKALNGSRCVDNLAAVREHRSPRTGLP